MDDKCWLDILTININNDYNEFQFATKIMLLDKNLSTYMEQFGKYIKLYYITSRSYTCIWDDGRMHIITYKLPNEKIHREEKDPKTTLSLPARIESDGTQSWYKNGKCHREEKDPKTNLSLPAVIYASGTQIWYKNGKCHREEKDPKTGLTLPAIIYLDGTQKWYCNDLLHREDVDPKTNLSLPAIIYADGTQKWYRNGKRLHKNYIIRKNLIKF